MLSISCSLSDLPSLLPTVLSLHVSASLARDSATVSRISQGVGLRSATVGLDRLLDLPVPVAPSGRAAPHRRQDRGTLLRPRCRGRRPGAGASQPEAVSSRRPQGGGRGQTHRGLAGAAPRHRTRLRPPRTHPHRAPPPVGARPTRQVRPGGQAATEGVAGEVLGASHAGIEHLARFCRMVVLGDRRVKWSHVRVDRQHHGSNRPA